MKLWLLPYTLKVAQFTFDLFREGKKKHKRGERGRKKGTQKDKQKQSRTEAGTEVSTKWGTDIELAHDVTTLLEDGDSGKQCEGEVKKKAMRGRRGRKKGARKDHQKQPRTEEGKAGKASH